MNIHSYFWRWHINQTKLMYMCDTCSNPTGRLSNTLQLITHCNNIWHKQLFVLFPVSSCIILVAYEVMMNELMMNMIIFNLFDTQDCLSSILFSTDPSDFYTCWTPESRACDNCLLSVHSNDQLIISILSYIRHNVMDNDVWCQETMIYLTASVLIRYWSIAG